MTDVTEEAAMRGMLIGLTVAGLLAAGAAAAHCDAEDGPVAAAARRALETGSVAPALPFAPEAAEAEIARAFAQATAVRALGPEARALADRHFTETLVRLHRVGEGAPYAGLRPAGLDQGPAIPAAERALASGDPAPLAELLGRALHAQLETRLHTARALPSPGADPASPAEVAAARRRVSADFAFIGWVEGLHRAIEGDVHAAAAEAHHD